MRSITQPLQDLLLQASFLDGESSLQAWNAWRSEVDLEAALDPGSFRLLPLAYRNLKGQGLEDPLFPKIKGISHQSWTRNRLLLEELKGVLTELQAAGVVGMALGALAQVLHGHPDISFYPSKSCSLLVREEQALQVAGILAKKWQASPEWPVSDPQRAIATRSSWLFYTVSGWKLRVRWRLDGRLGLAAWQTEMWNRDGAAYDPVYPIFLPDSESQIILTTLVEPYPARPSFFLQVVNLQMTLERCAGELDWKLLVRMIQELGLAARFLSLAEYLEDRLKLSGHYPGFSSILELKPGSIEMFKESISWQRCFSMESLPYAWIEAWQKNYRLSRSRKLGGFLKLLKERWKAQYLWQTPWFLLSTWLLRRRQP